ncbi:hypothetical protein T09_11521 [Trichinella sp. T9]|nr:hypothetical protein T09_11521 [Trichinella sp. T9]
MRWAAIRLGSRLKSDWKDAYLERIRSLRFLADGGMRLRWLVGAGGLRPSQFGRRSAARTLTTPSRGELLRILSTQSVLCREVQVSDFGSLDSVARAFFLKYLAVLTEILSCQRQDSSSASFASDEEPVFSNFTSIARTSCNSCSDHRWFFGLWEDVTNVEACFRFSCSLRPLKVLNVRQHAGQTCEVAAVADTSESSGVTVAGAGTLFATFRQCNVVVRAVIYNTGENSFNVLACLACEWTRVGKSETSSNIAYRALARSASNSSNRSLCWISRAVHSFSHQEVSQTSFQSDLDRAAAHAVYPRFLRLKSPRLESVQQLTCRLQCQFQNPLHFVRGALSTRP